MSLYPYPVPAVPVESLWGYTHRLASENLLDRHVWLRQDIGIAGNTADLDAGQLEKLSEISGVSAQVLRNMQHGERDLQNAWFFGHEVRRRRLELVRSRFCPLCVGASGYHNRIFDLRMLRACPIHRIELIETCPICDVGLNWHRNDIQHCSRGHRVWSNTGDVEFKVTEIDRDLRAERLIFERCGQAIAGGAVLPTLPEPVRTLALESQLVLFSLLGVARRDFPEEYRRGRQWRYSIRTWQLLNDGLEMAEHLPSSLTEWLEARYEPGGNGPSDMGPQILPLQNALNDAQLTAAPALRLILIPLTQFARSKGHLGKLNSGWIAPIDPTGDEISLGQAAGLMGVKVRKAKTIAARERWAIFGRKQDAAATIVSKANVQAWLEAGGDDLCCREAGRLLGISDDDVMELAKHRLIGAPRSGHAYDKLAKQNWHFKRYSVARLKRKLRENVADAPSIGAGTSFPTYRKTTQGSAISYSQIIRAVFKRKLRIVTWPSSGLLSEIEFLSRDLDVVLRGTTKRRKSSTKVTKSQATGRTYSLRALEVRFGANARTVSKMVSAGYLRATLNAKGDQAVTEADLQVFESMYVLITKAAKDRKVHSYVELRQRFRRAGVEPAAHISSSPDALLYKVADIAGL